MHDPGTEGCRGREGARVEDEGEGKGGGRKLGRWGRRGVESGGL